MATVVPATIMIMMMVMRVAWVSNHELVDVSFWYMYVVYKYTSVECGCDWVVGGVAVVGVWEDEIEEEEEEEEEEEKDEGRGETVEEEEEDMKGVEAKVGERRRFSSVEEEGWRGVEEEVDEEVDDVDEVDEVDEVVGLGDEEDDEDEDEDWDKDEDEDEEEDDDVVVGLMEGSAAVLTARGRYWTSMKRRNTSLFTD